MSRIGATVAPARSAWTCAWRILVELLLDADGITVRDRRHEPGMGRGDQRIKYRWKKQRRGVARSPRFPGVAPMACAIAIALHR